MKGPLLRWLRLGAALAGLGFSAAIGAAEASPGFVLSEQGSGRATAYPPTNKIVTRDGRTHVTWLDAADDTFWVRIRTLDHQTGRWSEPVTVAQAQDNHGGAALAIDAEGYLHLAYYPHHDAMRYRRSLRPHDASAWSAEERFGYNLTYPVLMVTPGGGLLLTARRSYDSHEAFAPPVASLPWETELWSRAPGTSRWERVGPLLRARFPGYAQFAEAFWWGEGGRTLHLACRIYETDYRGDRTVHTTVGYLMSHDEGRTWTRRDGSAVALPASADDLDVVARGRSAESTVLVGGGVVADGNDRPLVLYSTVNTEGAKTWLAHPSAEGPWQARDLSNFLDLREPGWELNLPGAITRSADGTITIAVTLQRLGPGESWWAHPSNEVARLWSRDGEHFEVAISAPADPTRPRWLPNLERDTGHHSVSGTVGIIFTDGEAGSTNDDMVSNRVIWWRDAAP